MRRLPVYLLLDTSGSMTGEPIEAIKNGVYMHLSQGSTNNIKPAAVMDFLY